MARCLNELVANGITNNKLDKFMEVDFSITEDIDSCLKINTRNYLETSGVAAYNKLDRPDDKLNCHVVGCINTGTLSIDFSGVEDEDKSVKFNISTNALRIAGGVIMFYAYLPAGTHSIDVAVSDIVDVENGDVYTFDVDAPIEDFYPVAIDLSSLPNYIEGTGWLPTDKGIQIEVLFADEETNVGISSIQIFESVEVLEANDTVKISCLDDITGDITVDATDATCFGGGYDADSVAVEKTITGKKATPNYWKLNPLMQKSDKIDGFILSRERKEVLKTVVNGINYGYVELNDLYEKECSYVYAALDDSCNVTDSVLNKVQTPVALKLNTNQFIVNGTKLLVNKELIGKMLMVSYPKAAEVEHYVANDEALPYRHTKMSYVRTTNDGVRYVYTFNNVLVTSFPDSLNKDEATFEFTATIQRDLNGNFYEMSRIL